MIKFVLFGRIGVVGDEWGFEIDDDDGGDSVRIELIDGLGGRNGWRRNGAKKWCRNAFEYNWWG